MRIKGRVRRGVILLPKGVTLPEGAEVIISCESQSASDSMKEAKRVEFPLVHSKHPGTLQLTFERVAELLDQDDAPRH